MMGERRFMRFLDDYTSLSERYAEAFYGIIMVTGCTGMVSMGVPKDEAGVQFMLWTALLVNILWGLIDGVTVIYGSLVDEVSADVAVDNARSGKQVEQSEGEVLGALSDSLVGKLSEEDKAKVAEVIRTSASYEHVDRSVGWKEIRRIMAIFLVDFVTVFPVTIPYMVFSDVVVAARWSFIIATILMGVLGYQWAKQARMRRWRVATYFMSFTILLLAISYALGGI
jgi:hypothetical protein